MIVLHSDERWINKGDCSVLIWMNVIGRKCVLQRMKDWGLIVVGSQTTGPSSVGVSQHFFRKGRGMKESEYSEKKGQERRNRAPPLGAWRSSDTITEKR